MIGESFTDQAVIAIENARLFDAAANEATHSKSPKNPSRTWVPESSSPHARSGYQGRAIEAARLLLHRNRLDSHIVHYGPCRPVLGGL